MGKDLPVMHTLHNGMNYAHWSQYYMHEHMPKTSPCNYNSKKCYWLYSLKYHEVTLTMKLHFWLFMLVRLNSTVTSPPV